MRRGGLRDIAIVDLSAGTVTCEPVTRQLALEYIGGQGIGSYLLSASSNPASTHSRPTTPSSSPRVR